MRRALREACACVRLLRLIVADACIGLFVAAACVGLTHALMR